MDADSLKARFPNLHLLPQTEQLRGLMTIIRDRSTRRNDFIFYADRVTRLLVEQALELLPTEAKDVETPLGEVYHGLRFPGRICAVAIMRSGEAMEKAAREVCKKIRLGKILIQRDEETALPTVLYSKLPKDIKDRWVLLLDPMLATGGSAREAIRILVGAGVDPAKIIFVNLLSCPEGLEVVFKEDPALLVVSGQMDAGLNAKAYIRPGLGDFGDRYFGT
jgi:uracil phosphoribosyltransferase